MPTEDEIENETDDLRNALSDLLRNGPNEDDEHRVKGHFGKLELMLLDLMEAE